MKNFFNVFCFSNFKSFGCFDQSFVVEDKLEKSLVPNKVRNLGNEIPVVSNKLRNLETKGFVSKR